MKVLSFSYCFPTQANPNWGIFVFQRTNALAKFVDLKVCSPVPWFPFLAPGGKTAHGNWKGLEISRPRFFYTPKFFKNNDARFYARGILPWVKKLCLNWQPDILDSHFIWPDGVAVSLIAQDLGIPYVITLRGKLFECMKEPSQVRQCTQALKKASAVISVSSGLAETAIELGADPSRMSVIPNGVDAQNFNIKEKNACRKSLGLPEDKKILVTVAHLGHRKGHHEVIRALAGLPENVCLVLVGGPAQGGTPETIMAEAEKSGVKKRIILTGPQSYDQVARYFSAADASVLASYREGCPNAVLESLACGTPVVATDVGAVRDILPVPGAGCIVPRKEVEPLKNGLKEVLAAKWDPESVIKASKVRSWEQVALDVQAVFRTIVKA
ncbi:glycosyltransferase [uncultured Desulfobacter sp.]|uniref:glycosyltransferase n=1 Tax=uncultured Desulfobacter sp. TaxID=240139 RepID=UPI002AAB5C6C|nr:glycosyltransferase [uncultured Desulfobacter sp.]